MSLLKDLVENHLLDVKTFTPEQLAKHHKVDVSLIKAQLKKGIKIEQEHTSDKKIAREIALDHLKEDPKYYNKLQKMEEQLIREYNEKTIDKRRSRGKADEEKWRDKLLQGGDLWVKSGKQKHGPFKSESSARKFIKQHKYLKEPRIIREVWDSKIFKDLQGTIPDKYAKGSDYWKGTKHELKTPTQDTSPTNQPGVKIWTKDGSIYNITDLPLDIYQADLWGKIRNSLTDDEFSTISNWAYEGYKVGGGSDERDPQGIDVVDMTFNDYIADLKDAIDLERNP